MRRHGLHVAAAILLFGGINVARADDTDIFLNAPTVQPNVVLLIDTSGSMGDTVNGAVKMDSAKAAAIDIVTNTSGMRFGVFRFNTDSTGAHIVAPVGTAVSSIVSSINGMTPTGATPLGRATDDVEEYFFGTYQEGVTTSGTGECNRGHGHGHSYGHGTSGRDTDSCRTTSLVSYPSPIQYECQKNFLIIITDGLPNGEATNLVSDVATSLYTTDHSSTLTGMQNVVVYTVGFNTPEGTALLTQTAANGGGQFYAVDDSDTLSTALHAILSDVGSKVYTFNAPLIPSTGTSGAGKAYLGSFDPDPIKPFWPGYIKAYTTDSAGMIVVQSDGTPDPSTLAWEAGALLKAKAPSSRTIFTYFSSARQDFNTTNASITTAMLGLTLSADRTKLINFVRGVDTYDENLNANTTETRSWVLGDPFHSTPALVIPPPGTSSDSTYQTFKTAQASRTKVLLVGANDGMLHAFRESDGQELWGYIPQDELATLKNLRPTSLTHPYFVDSSPMITDIKVGSTWKTVVIFGERKGGMYYHCLDITDPTSPTFLWSFTDTRMGETWSEPALGVIKMSDSTLRYVAFVGGGYSSTSNNSLGKAVFAINLADGSKLWQYYNTNSADNQYMNYSLAASPVALDTDNDGDLDRVYIGDVGGQIWKFDVSPLATTSSGLINNWTGKRLFTAVPAQANPPASGAFAPAQAIYTRAAFANDSSGNLWLYIGTGDRNAPNSASSNYFYGIKENTSMTNATALAPTSLVDAPATNTTITQGWKLALSSTEKVLADPEVNANAVYFTTYIPNSVATCVAPGGVARLYACQMTNGDSAWDWTGHTSRTGENNNVRYEVIGSGIPSRPTTIAGTSNDAIVIGTTDGQIVSETRTRSITKKVVYWREVY